MSASSARCSPESPPGVARGGFAPASDPVAVVIAAIGERFGSDCDAWTARVENRAGTSDSRVCDRSERLAEEWMEHHDGVSEHYLPVPR